MHIPCPFLTFSGADLAADKNTTFQGSKVRESEKLEKAGTVDFKKHPARKVGTRSRKCGPKVPGRFAFTGARNPRIYSISRFGKNAATFPGLSRSFPWEPPNRPRKQPQPSRVFWGKYRTRRHKQTCGIGSLLMGEKTHTDNGWVTVEVQLLV